MGKQTRNNVHLLRKRETRVTSDSSDSSHFSTRRVGETAGPHTLLPSVVQGKLLDFVMANKEPTGRVAGRETVVGEDTAQERIGATSGVSVTNHSGAATG